MRYAMRSRDVPQQAEGAVSSARPDASRAGEKVPCSDPAETLSTCRSWKRVDTIQLFCSAHLPLVRYMSISCPSHVSRDGIYHLVSPVLRVFTQKYPIGMEHVFGESKPFPSSPIALQQQQNKEFGIDSEQNHTLGGDLVTCYVVFGFIISLISSGPVNENDS